MKRFYTTAAVAPAPDGWTVTLDGRPVRTPGRRALVLPTERLADVVAAEWAAQGDTIDLASMPLGGLANAAAERIADDRAAVVAALAAYAETDLTCYRADHPADLRARQDSAWDPLLAWAARRHGVAFEVATGIVHRPQPPATVARLRERVDALDAWQLAGLHPIVTVTGSLVIGLALLDGAIDVDAAWRAGQLDELYQIEQWGDDPLALDSRAARRAALDAGARFLALLPGSPRRC